MRSRWIRGCALVSTLAAMSCGDPDGPIGMAWDEIHTVCATQTAIRGIDVSVYQGTIDWNAAARGGVRFAYMRLANNVTLDTTFVRNWTNSRSAGVLRGAYQYFNPHADAVAQANFVADTLMRNGFGPGDLPPMIDVEYPNSATNPLPSRAAYTTKVRQWLDTIRMRLGVDGVIYTGGYYWDANLNTNEFAAYNYWHAQYPNYYGPGDSRNRIYQFDVTPLPLNGCPTSVSNHWNVWRFWQFAGDNGRAPGVTGPVDNDAFNGTMDDLRRLARLPVMDAGVTDSGVTRDASADTGAPRDAASDSASPRDAANDSGTARDASADSAAMDASEPDVTEPDATVSDASASDGASARDASTSDGAALDAGPGEMTGGCGCRTSAAPNGARGSLAWASMALALGLIARRSRARRSR